MPQKTVRMTDKLLIERIEAYRQKTAEQTGLPVSFAQIVNVILRKGFAAIDAQPRKGAR